MHPVGGISSRSRGQGWHINIITWKGRYDMSFTMALGASKQTPFRFCFFQEEAQGLRIILPCRAV